MNYIYYILLENNKYYLTSYKTKLLKLSEILLSISKSAPDWLLINKPIRILKIIECNGLYSMENYIIDFMKIHGVKNVRGDIINDVILPTLLEKYLNERIQNINITTKYLNYIEEEYSESDDEINESFEYISINSSDNLNKKKSFISRLYKWLCYRKISNNTTKETLINK